MGTMSSILSRFMKSALQARNSTSYKPPSDGKVGCHLESGLCRAIELQNEFSRGIIWMFLHALMRNLRWAVTFDRFSGSERTDTAHIASVELGDANLHFILFFDPGSTANSVLMYSCIVR